MTQKTQTIQTRRRTKNRNNKKNNKKKEHGPSDSSYHFANKDVELEDVGEKLEEEERSAKKK